jgi:hypothetical protein
MQCAVSCMWHLPNCFCLWYCIMDYWISNMIRWPPLRDFWYPSFWTHEKGRSGPWNWEQHTHLHGYSARHKPRLHDCSLMCRAPSLVHLGDSTSMPFTRTAGKPGGSHCAAALSLQMHSSTAPQTEVCTLWLQNGDHIFTPPSSTRAKIANLNNTNQYANNRWLQVCSADLDVQVRWSFEGFSATRDSAYMLQALWQCSFWNCMEVKLFTSA